MDYSTLGFGLIVVATSLASAVLGLVLVVRLTPKRSVTWTPFEKIGAITAFLFEDEELVDATPEARAILSAGPEQMEPWPRLQAVLTPRFPDLATRLSGLGENQSLEVPSADGRTWLKAEWRAGLTRIEIEQAEDGGTRAAEFPGLDSLSLAAMQDELSDLRMTVDAAPVLIWKEDAAGAVRWANASYLEIALAADPESDTLSWPLPTLFAERAWAMPDTAAHRDGGATAGPAPPARLLYTDPDGGVTRYDGYWTKSGDSTVVFALPADRLAKAEASRDEFVQTLTKTFAHLPIGLAVFDRERRLAVFNPALTDLTNLQPLFLSRRPLLVDFLDELREARRMPEPKDYRDWRRRISDLEEAAATGTHVETWTLPDGQTFRVTGRPHPDGALAFLFEDITSEVALTRRFRSELELGQAVADSMGEAIAVFAPSGELVLSNTAYETLWDCTPNASIGGITYAEAERGWRMASRPSPCWDALHDRATGHGKGSGWSGEVYLTDGRGLRCRVARLAGNATLVGFSPLAGGRDGGIEPIEPASGDAPRRREASIG